MNSEQVVIEDAAILPAGFRAGGVAAGIKKGGGRDMALIASEVTATIAGVFTTNQVQAASVLLDRERLASGRARAVIVNSGNANACTGAAGLSDARDMGAAVAAALGVEEREVFVCSTGHIGARLPMDRIRAGVTTLANAISADGGADAALAIMTTDTRPKQATVTISVGGQPVRITGLAKGAGMIEPNMATMLAFVLTDASVTQPDLQACLAAAVDQSFNRISVDGDRSTNDTVLLLANGQSGAPSIAPGHADWPRFAEAVHAISHDLALKIMRDGEGASKVVTIHIAGAESDADADIAARSVGNSMLVKTSWAGTRPNWGRVMDALGYSRARVDADRVDIAYDGVPAARQGVAADTPLEKLKEVVARSAFTLDIHLNLGSGEAVVYSCDCTEEYVRINAE